MNKITERVDAEIQNNGVSRAMHKIINKTGTEILIVNKSKRLTNILKNHPVVIVANHPSEAEVLVLLAALEGRKDINLIANASLQDILPSFNENLIPVYIHNRLMNKPGIDRLKLKLLKKFHKTDNYSSEEEHQKNIESINLAAEKISKGNLVALFPGGGGDNGKWFNGVGHLISGVKNKEGAYIVKAYIEGTSNLDYLRLIPGISKFLPKFKVTYHEPIKMEEFENSDPKATTLILETGYNRWIEDLNNQKIPTKVNPPLMSNKGIYLARALILWFSAKLS